MELGGRKQKRERELYLELSWIANISSKTSLGYRTATEP